MPTPSSRSTETTRAKRAQPAPNAIDLLEADHKEVKRLFRDYDKLVQAGAAAADREALARQICGALKVHARIEEEIFYPAARDALDEEDLIDEAEVEHATAKDLIEQIESTQADATFYDAKVKVLGEYIDHHVKEEQDELFPKIRRRMDIKAVGTLLQERKHQLMTETPIPAAH
jgi:hemerythrin-like domain-containing protein